MSTHESSAAHAYPLADFLVGPFHPPSAEGVPGSPETLEPWQVPFYRVAIGALERVAQGDVQPGWQPTPQEGAELYRDLAYYRRVHTMIAGLKAYCRDMEEGRVGTNLYPHQRDVIRVVADRLGTLDPSAETIDNKLPPGSGKTVIMISLVHALRYLERPNERARILIEVPTRDLVLQFRREFARFMPEEKVGEVFSDRKDIRDTTVMTYRSFDIGVRNGTIRKGDFDVIFKDEDHESEGDMVGESLDDFTYDEFNGHHTIVFAFSATPKPGELAYNKTLVEALGEGLLSPIRAKAIQAMHPLHPALRRGKKRNEYTDAELQELIHKDPLGQLIADETLKALADGRRVLLRCVAGAELVHAEILQQILKNRGRVPIRHPYMGDTEMRGVRAVVVRGSMSAEQRRLVYEAFEDEHNSLVDVILFQGVAKRGLNLHMAKAVIDVSANLQLDVLEQVLGRITRPLRRRNGKVVVGQAITILPLGVSQEQLTFVDVINRSAPVGMRYREGAVIGKGLRDLRDPESEPNSAFEPIEY